MYLFGRAVRGGRHGAPPSLTDLDENGNLRYSTDFRSVYATLLADWFDTDPGAILEGDGPGLPLLRPV